MKFYTIFSAISIAALPSAISAMDTLEVGNQPNVQQNVVDAFDADVRRDASDLLKDGIHSVELYVLTLAFARIGRALDCPRHPNPVFAVPAIIIGGMFLVNTAIWGVNGFAKLVTYGDAAINPFSKYAVGFKERAKAAGVATLGAVAMGSTAFIMSQLYHAL